MAKQRQITAPTGADANMRTLGDAQPVRDTIAGVIRSALALVAALKTVVINFGFATGAKAVVAPTGGADPAPAGVELLGSFEKDDASKASSPWTYTNGDASGPEATALGNIVGTRKPSLSVESLTNALEDENADPLGAFLPEDNGIVVKYDQANGVVKVFRTDLDTLAAYDPAGAYAEDASFLGVEASSTGAQFGE